MHLQHAVAPRRQRGVVGNEDERCATLAVAAEQQLDDVAAGGLVEIAGRFVGDENCRIGRQRAGERDALLLAAGKLGWIVMQARREADRGELLPRPRQRIGPACELERHRDVFQRCHGRDQMKGLEYDADAAAAETGEAVFIEPAEVLPGDHDTRRNRPAPVRSSPSAASICPNQTGRAGRPPRRDLY